MLIVFSAKVVIIFYLFLLSLYFSPSYGCIIATCFLINNRVFTNSKDIRISIINIKGEMGKLSSWKESCRSSCQGWSRSCRCCRSTRRNRSSRWGNWSYCSWIRNCKVSKQKSIIALATMLFCFCTCMQKIVLSLLINGKTNIIVSTMKGTDHVALMHWSRGWSYSAHLTHHAHITFLSCTAHVARHGMIT